MHNYIIYGTTICNYYRYLDIDIGTKHRLVAFKRPIIFIIF